MKNKGTAFLIIIVLFTNIFLCGSLFYTKLSINKLRKELNIEIGKYKTVQSELDKNKKEQEKYQYVKNPAKKIPIITFHRIVDHETKETHYKDNEWVNDVNVTDEELKYLYDNGWKSIDLDEFACWYNKECEFEEKTFVITIDDGDSEAYYNMLPLLQKYNFKATLFAIGKEIPDGTAPLNEPTRNKLGWDIISQLRESKSLLQVESHTYNLHAQLDNGKEIASSKTKEEILEDLKANEKYGFKYLAYPYGYYDQNFLEAISEYKNIKMAFIFKKKGYATRLDNRYEIKRLKVNGIMKLEDFKKLFEYAK